MVQKVLQQIDARLQHEYKIRWPEGRLKVNSSRRIRMPDSRDKRAAEIQDSIRQVLYHEWDPIGVAGLGPGDEYDRYIAPVYRVLIGSRSEDELVDLLHETEREEIGTACESREQLRPLVRRLLALNVKL